MTQSSRTFRIFISSTFSDLKQERDALQKNVFPRLRDLAMTHGFRFQAIDLRWGVSEEAALDQQTMKICLDEIDHCQKNMLKPNFLILMGDRYGWRPLPHEIPATEMQKIIKYLSPTQSQLTIWEENDEIAGIPEMASWNGGQIKGQYGWYRLDRNAIPEVYVLQPRPKGSIFESYTAWESEVEHPLGMALEQASRQVGFNDVELVKLFYSATGQEIFNGVLQTTDAHKHVFGFLRTINNLDSLENDLNEEKLKQGDKPLVRHFIDLDSDQKPDGVARSHLQELRKQIKEYLTDHVFEYSSTWTGNGISTDHLDQFCADVESSLRSVMELEFQDLDEIDPLQAEIAEHISFSTQLDKNFFGKRDEVAQIIDYFTNPLIGPFPLVIQGSEGSGKSALIAVAYKRSQFYCKNGETIVRFIGHTPDSANSRTFLAGLCEEIGVKLGVPVQEVPDDYDNLCKLFVNQIAKVRPEKPLTLCLDSIDRLVSDKEEAFDWLPVKLPEGVRLIFSVGSRPPARLLQIMGQRFTPLVISSLKRDEGEVLLKHWLEEKRRTLTENQLEQVLKTLSYNGSPQVLRFAFEESLFWKSYTLTNLKGGDISSLIQQSFTKLSKEENHGSVLVSRVLGYLANAKSGLTEDELLDLLSMDEVVMTDFHRRSPKSPDTLSLPVVIWARLSHDLSPYLTIRRHNGLEYLILSYIGTGLLSLYVQFEKIALSEIQTGRYSGYAAPSAVHAWMQGKTILHARMAEFFEKQPSFLDESRTQPNWHRAAELLFHIKMAGNLAGYPEKSYTALLDFDYIQAKVQSFDIRTLVEEYDSTISVGLPSEKERVLNLIKRTLVLSGMAVKRDVNQLSGQLIARLMKFTEPEISAFLTNVRENACRPFLFPLDPCLESASTTLISSTNFKTCTRLAISSNARWGINAFDRNLSILDLDKGEILHSFATFSGYTPGSIVTAVAIFDDGKYAISAKEDYLQVWDVQGIILHKNRSAPRCNVLKDHLSAITCLDISSPDRKSELHLALSGTKDGTLNFWSLDQLTCIKVLEGHTAAVKAVKFSENGQWACSLAEDDTLRVWDLKQGKCVFVLSENIHNTRSVAISPDGNFVAFDQDKTILVLDWKRKTIPLKIPYQTDWVKTIFVNSKHIVALGGGREGNIKVWNIKDGLNIQTFIHEGGLLTGCLNGKRELFHSGSKSGVIKTWSLESNSSENAEIKSRSHKKLLTSGDKSKVFSSAADGEMTVYEVSTGKRLMRSFRHIGEISSIAVSPNGKNLLTGGEDGALLVWDLETGERILRLAAHSKTVLGVIVSPAGDLSISYSFDEFAICDLIRNSCLHIIPEKVFAADFLPNSNFVITISVTAIQIWDLNQGQCIKSNQTSYPSATQAQLSSDGKKVVIASNDGEIHVWDVENGKLLHGFNCGLRFIHVLALSHDDKLLAIATESKVEVWNLSGENTKPIFSVRNNGVNSLEFDPDGSRLFSGSENGSIYELNLSTGSLLNFIKNINYLSHFRTVPGHNQIVTTSKNRQIIQVWDLEKSETVKTYETLFNRSYEQPPIQWISPDGQFLLVLGGNKDRRYDHDIHIYDLKKGIFTGEIKGHINYIQSLAFIPGTPNLISSSKDGSIRLWDWIAEVERCQMNGFESPALHLLPIENSEQVIVYFQNQSLMRVDLHEGSIIWSNQDLSSPIKSIWLNDSGSLVFSHSEDKIVRSYNTLTGQQHKTLEHILGNPSNLVISPDGTRAIANNKDQWKLWDLENGSIIKDLGNDYWNLWRGISNLERNHQIGWGELRGVHVKDFLGDKPTSIFQSKADLLSLAYIPEMQLLWVTDLAGEIFRLCYITEDYDWQFSDIEPIEIYTPIKLPIVADKQILTVEQHSLPTGNAQEFGGEGINSPKLKEVNPNTQPPTPSKSIKKVVGNPSPSLSKEMTSQVVASKKTTTIPQFSSPAETDKKSTPLLRRMRKWLIGLFILIFLIAAYLVFDQVLLPTPEISQTPLPMVTQVVP